MEEQTDKQYCQSCGMPLRFDVEEYLGTNRDHSPSDEYCYYCLKDGEYTVDIPMEEMVDIWVKYTDKYNWYSGTDYTSQELRTLLNRRMPTLKRWRQKEETEYVHHDTVGRIKNHIDANLFADLDPEQLAGMANLSFFHFRRVFKNVTGENIGAYIQRLRLEYVAHLLIATGQSLDEIRLQTGYQTKFSLAKAFKKHFGLTMSEYRAKYRVMDEDSEQDDMPRADIRRINVRQAVCLEVGNTSHDRHTYNAKWAHLSHYRNKLSGDTSRGSNFVSISRDNPLVTPSEQCRFYIGLITDSEVKLPKGFVRQDIPGGMYAVFRHKGNYAGLPDFYKSVYEHWLPRSKYVQKYPMTLEVYENTPGETAVADLITDVYIPIDKK